MTAVSSSSDLDGLEGRRLAGQRLAQRLGALDRGLGGRVGGDHEEVLAALGLLEAGVALGADGELRRALEAEVGLRVRVVEVVGHLAALEQHVERHHRRAGLEDAVVDDREVGQVGTAQGDLVAGLDAARDQQVGDLVGGAVDLRVGQPGVAEHHGRTVRVGPGGAFEQRGEVRHVANLLSGRDARHPSVPQNLQRDARSPRIRPALRRSAAMAVDASRPAAEAGTAHGTTRPTPRPRRAPASRRGCRRSAGSTWRSPRATSRARSRRRKGASSVVSIRGRTPTDVVSSQAWPRCGSSSAGTSTERSDDCHSGRLRGSTR